MALTFSKIYIDLSSLQLSNASGYPYTFRGSWDDTTQALAVGGQYWQRNATQTGTGSTTAGNPWKTCILKVITDPLEAEAGYTGTLNTIIGAHELNAGTDAYWYIHVWVTVGDTDAVRTTLLSNYGENTTNEWATTSTGKALQSAQSIAGSWQRGDRIVFELGAIRRGVTAGTVNLVYRSDKDEGDLTVGSTSVSSLNGILQFSAPLTLAAPNNSIIDNAEVVGSLPFDQTYDAQYGILESEAQVNPDFYVPVFDNGGFGGYIQNVLWMKYVATYTGTLYLSVDGSTGLDVATAVWEDVTAANLKSGSEDFNNIWYWYYPDDATPSPIPVVSGSTYWILLGFDQNGPNYFTPGTIDVKLQATPFGGAPANDDCANATVTVAGDTSSLSTTNATVEAGDPIPSIVGAAVYKTVWYEFTAPQDGLAIFDHTTDYASVIFVGTGACGATTEVMSTLGLYAQWTATGGTVYRIMVGAIADDGGALTTDFHFMSALEDTSIAPHAVYPYELDIEATFPTGTDPDAWYRSFALCPGSTQWGELDPDFQFVLGLEPEQFAFPYVLIVPCGNRFYRVRFRQRVFVDGLGDYVYGPQTILEATTTATHGISFPLGALLRTWEMQTGGSAIGTDEPFAFFLPIMGANGMVWARLDGTGGNVTFVTERHSNFQNPDTGDPTAIPVALTYAAQTYLWFGVRDFAIVLDVQSNQTHQVIPLAERTVDQHLFESGITLGSNVYHHVGYSAIQTGGSYAAGIEWTVTFYVDGAPVGTPLVYTGIANNNLFVIANGGGGGNTGSAPGDLVWAPYVSFGGMQNEDGTASDYFTDTGGVTLARFRNNISVDFTDAMVLEEFQSCEIPVNPPSVGLDPFGQYGLWGTSSPAAYPAFDDFIDGGGVTLIDAQQGPSPCSCASCGKVLGPIAWLEWNRVVP